MMVMEAKTRVGDPVGVSPCVRSKSYESRLAANPGWQEEYQHPDQTKTTASPAQIVHKKQDTDWILAGGGDVGAVLR